MSDYVIVSGKEDFRNKLLSGVNTLADAVKVTMGPNGQNVLIEKSGQYPILTKDGVTVAKNINLKEKIENLAATVIKEAASRTAEEAGDGTTTSTVLAQAIFQTGLKYINSGYKLSDMKRGIDFSVEFIKEQLKKRSTYISTRDDLFSVASISANGEKDLANLIVDAVHTSGIAGNILVEEAKGYDSSLEIVEGYKIERGYISPYFINNEERSNCRLDKPLICLVDGKIDTLKSIVPLLEQALETEASLLLVADDFESDALKALVLNKVKGSLKICCIKSPGFGESRRDLMSDLSMMTGAPILDVESELENVSLDILGSCDIVEVNRNSTSFIGCKTDNDIVTKRVTNLQKNIDDPSLDPKRVAYLRNRIASLMGKTSILRIGGSTEAEMLERKDRADDALSAARVALVSGVLPGGGIALARLSDELDSVDMTSESDSFRAGVSIVKQACFYPFSQILNNAGLTPEVVFSKIQDKDFNVVFDVRKNCNGDARTVGLIDPAQVVVSAITNAASAAVMLLSTGCVIVER